ncbi:MAG: YabP/YqfC family sporulation protein [Clostridiales bacterium]|nr:YabP/YqfC family sporulation protein [Clostridiales bacterium]MCD8367535.1 YabP/YqfC family sporulation protein [Clostridiales bacterium]
MARGERWKILAQTADALSLPPELAPGTPVLELYGSGQLRMENHRGIIAYGSEEISVSGGKLLVRIQGKNLELRSMSADALFITGSIENIRLE